MSNWEAVIELRAALALKEIRQMADEAYKALGFTQAWINRSRGQRKRRERKNG